MTPRATEHDRPQAGEYAAYQEIYVSRVPGGPIVQTLRHQSEETLALLRRVPEEGAMFAYAPGKWTIKEVIGHLIDTERVMVYRALRFARNDATALPGFDENLYAAEGRFATRSVASLTGELAAVRTSTAAFFEGISPEAWLRSGNANDYRLTVRGLAYVIAGHELHHVAILKERYHLR
jgi:hypothetical protein